MGSSFFGVPNNMGTERCSPRKSKKPEKPKQPQRGLGVAQLEQIRLRSQMGCGLTPPYPALLQDDMRLQGVQPYGVPHSSTSCPPYSQSSPSTSSHYAYSPNYMMVFGDERANTRYNEPHQSTMPRWNPNNNGVLDNSPYTQTGIASAQLFSHFEDSRQKMGSWRPMGSSPQSSNSSDDEEVDLELRL